MDGFIIEIAKQLASSCKKKLLFKLLTRRLHSSIKIYKLSRKHYSKLNNKRLALFPDLQEMIISKPIVNHSFFNYQMLSNLLSLEIDLDNVSLDHKYKIKTIAYIFDSIKNVNKTLKKLKLKLLFEYDFKSYNEIMIILKKLDLYYLYLDRTTYFNGSFTMTIRNTQIVIGNPNLRKYNHDTIIDGQLYKTYDEHYQVKKTDIEPYKPTYSYPISIFALWNYTF